MFPLQRVCVQTVRCAQQTASQKHAFLPPLSPAAQDPQRSLIASPMHSISHCCLRHSMQPPSPAPCTVWTHAQHHALLNVQCPMSMPSIMHCVIACLSLQNVVLGPSTMHLLLNACPPSCTAQRPMPNAHAQHHALCNRMPNTAHCSTHA